MALAGQRLALPCHGGIAMASGLCGPFSQSNDKKRGLGWIDEIENEKNMYKGEKKARIMDFFYHIYPLRRRRRPLLLLLLSAPSIHAIALIEGER